MDSYANIRPGARVQTDEGIVGTVERLEHLDGEGGPQPDYMVVRSDDGRRLYNLPMLLVRDVSRNGADCVVYLTIGPDELQYYVTQEVRGQGASDEDIPPVQSGEWAPDDQNAVLRVPLAAEILSAQKQPIELGTVHIHKGVETFEQGMEVPVYHEEAIVEHIPPDQYDGSAPLGANEMIIPVIEERLVVEKRSVVKEYIRIRKNVVAELQQVHDTLRREVIELTEQRQEGEAADRPLMREAT